MDVPLDATATYVSPAGHRCRWEPLGGKARHYTVAAYFVYLDKPKQLFESEGFYLNECNYHLLKKEIANAVA